MSGLGRIPGSLATSGFLAAAGGAAGFVGAGIALISAAAVLGFYPEIPTRNLILLSATFIGGLLAQLPVHVPGSFFTKSLLATAPCAVIASLWGFPPLLPE